MVLQLSQFWNVHVPEFVDVIWVAVSDPTLASLKRAVEALGAWLLAFGWFRSMRCYWIFEAAQAGLGKNAPVYSIHGSLLSVGELLRNSSEFMMSRYRDLADILLVYMEHKHRLVHLSTASLLPHIAHFQRDCFIANHLKEYDVEIQRSSWYSSCKLENKDWLVCFSITSLLPRTVHFQRGLVANCSKLNVPMGSLPWERWLALWMVNLSTIRRQ